MTTNTGNWQSHPEVTRTALVDDLRRLGLDIGQTVLVHSSLSRLGRVTGGADTVIDALLAVVGSSGTLLFPTLTGTEMDGPEHPPVVDVRVTPCWTGRIPETARQRPDARRSLHPTHSVTALGADAASYASGHETGESPCDVRSPYHRLIRDNGWILLLGNVTQESNTTLHCLEELAGVPYHLQPLPTDGVVIDASGQRHVVRNRLHLWGWERNFLKVDGPLASQGAVRSGAVGTSTSRLIAVGPLVDVVLPRLQADPLYLLAEHAKRAFGATQA
jgi:aminoglycoside 3-N-acetyltransferase